MTDRTTNGHPDLPQAWPCDDECDDSELEDDLDDEDSKLTPAEYKRLSYVERKP